MILGIWGNPWQSPHISWGIQVWSWKIFEQSRFDVPVSKMLKQVNHQVAVIVIWHIRQLRQQWWKEDKIQSTKIACLQNIWNRWQYEIYCWRRFRTLVSCDKIKETVRPRKLEFDEALQEHLQKFITGDFWWVRSRRISKEKIPKYKRQGNRQKQSSLTNSVRCIKRKFWDMHKTMAAIWKHSLFLSSSGLGKSRFTRLNKKILYH